MSTEVQSDSSKTKTLDEMVRRARSLYSLPAIAAEVIELTGNPKVDIRALKDCIEVDPALTAKILRVVNSSLFGLSREVSDLNQAIALLGIKPLKLLVLGFSLPAELFGKVARDQLDWYWTTTLSRAVAAREISEQLWQRPGDDAFLAGLLQDIGVLVLLGELQEPYAQFLGRVIDERMDLQQVEVVSMGFGHTELSAALLEHWKMPELLVGAISERRDSRLLKQKNTQAGELARILHLAGLLAELVAQRRLGVLPELLETGEAYCGLDKARLNELVASLQPKVEQLADVLSLDLCEGDDYPSIVAEAHSQMSQLAERVAGALNEIEVAEDQACEGMLEDATDLRRAVDDFLHSPAVVCNEPISLDENEQTAEIGSLSSVPIPKPDSQQVPKGLRGLAAQLTLAVGRCRSMRQPLSVVLFEVETETEPSERDEQLISHVLDVACREVDCEGMTVEVLAPCRRAIVLPGCERQEAVRHSQSTIQVVETALAGLQTLEGVADAGVATVALPSKNFPPLSLLETAERCLSAAQTNGASVVKSLEVY
ncbi:MAG: HDOD domain-containing protein [Planctomycetes bacterium]|nr:HDOD domain-containing protein [Planctomycetota bacterium]